MRWVEGPCDGVAHYQKTHINIKGVVNRNVCPSANVRLSKIYTANIYVYIHIYIFTYRFKSDVPRSPEVWTRPLPPFSDTTNSTYQTHKDIHADSDKLRIHLVTRLSCYPRC